VIVIAIAEDARRRLVSYRTREGGSFAFAEELALKRRQLSDVDEALAASMREDSQGVEQAA